MDQFVLLSNPVSIIRGRRDRGGREREREIEIERKKGALSTGRAKEAQM
jgi:hypothetical protein